MLPSTGPGPWRSLVDGLRRAQAFCEIVAVQLKLTITSMPWRRRARRSPWTRPGSVGCMQAHAGTASRGHIREAVRDFERCESEWTTSIDGTEMSEAELARMRRSLDNNLRSCRRRLAEKQLAETLREDEQLLHPSMNHVMKGDFDKAAESAERTASLLLSGSAIPLGSHASLAKPQTSRAARRVRFP